jgi:hypothetical protein
LPASPIANIIYNMSYHDDNNSFQYKKYFK